MNAPASKETPALMGPGASYYTVLERSTVLAPDGSPTFGMVGPFPTLAHANQHAAAKPGSIIAVTLLLHESQPAPLGKIIPQK